MCGRNAQEAHNVKSILSQRLVGGMPSSHTALKYVRGKAQEAHNVKSMLSQHLVGDMSSSHTALIMCVEEIPRRHAMLNQYRVNVKWEACPVAIQR